MRSDQILLVDTDSKIPNLALTRIASFHKERGDTVSLQTLGLSGYPSANKPKEVDGARFGRDYVSTIFTHNRHMVDVRGAGDVVFGGTGIDLKIKLPAEIESMPMDCSVYPQHNDTGYGFITRGCIRSCPFCFVPRKEGRLRKINDIDDIIKPQHKQVKFLDNNFLAYPGHEKLLEDLIRRGVKCTFSQGLDIRCLNECNARLLDQLNYLEEYIFAFDDVGLQPVIEKKLAMLRGIEFQGRLKFFVFVSPKYTNLQDDVFRVKWCIENNCLPYVMRENTCWASGHRDFYVDLASWCNQPKLFKKMDFQTYLSKRHPKNLQRRERSAEIFFGNHPEMAGFWGDVAHRFQKPVKKIRQVQLGLFN